MARKARSEVAPGVYHVFARGIDRRELFGDDVDRRRYLVLLGSTTVRLVWRTLAYCLMGNHVHLLIETTEPNLGNGMQRIHGAHAQAFNRRHKRTGHVFERRYGAVPILSDGQLRTVAEYLARNPVEAGLCASPEDWMWGSYGAVSRGAGWPVWLDVARLLEFYASLGGDPGERYVRSVAEAARA